MPKPPRGVPENVGTASRSTFAEVGQDRCCRNSIPLRTSAWPLRRWQARWIRSRDTVRSPWRRALARALEVRHRSLGSGMIRPETHRFEDAGAIPNSRLPVLVYHDIDGARAAQDCAELFARNGWRGAWVDGSTPSTLPLDGARGARHRRRLRLRRPRWPARASLRGRAGAMSLSCPPAPGTARRRDGRPAGLGAYPNGMWCDLRRGDPAEREEVLANIAGYRSRH